MANNKHSSAIKQASIYINCHISFVCKTTQNEKSAVVHHLADRADHRCLSRGLLLRRLVCRPVPAYRLHSSAECKEKTLYSEPNKSLTFPPFFKNLGPDGLLAARHAVHTLCGPGHDGVPLVVWIIFLDAFTLLD